MSQVAIKNSDIPIVQSLRSVSLQDLEKVKLQSRLDTKYVLNAGMLPSILEKLKNEYLVMEIEGKRLMKYVTLYYDTKDFHFFNQHHNGKLNRYKIRSRTYVDTDTSFVEIKFKNNKSTTIKTRKGCDSIPKESLEDFYKFINKNMPLGDKELEPKLWVYYSRITLTNNAFTERVTLDLHLTFDNEETIKAMPEILIAEIKQDKFSGDSAIVSLFREMKLEPMGFSKYCLGIASTYDSDTVKKNNFKPKLRAIEKIAQGYQRI